MMASVFLSRVIGLLREMVIAYIGGAKGDVDAYQIAFVIPEILNHILASGFLSVTFIPIFSHYLAQNREDEGWRVFSIILTCFGSILAFFIVLAEFFIPQLIDLLAPGLKDPAVKYAAVKMTRIILPAQFFFFAGGLFTAVQFAKEKFAIPALAPLIYNLGIIAGGLALGHYIGMEAFSYGVFAGAFIGNFVLQWHGAKKVGMKFCFCFDLRHPDLKKYIRLTLPLMLGLTMTFSTEIFLKFFGSYLPKGSISALNYGLRVMLMLVGFFGQAVGVASFPFMTRLIAENKLNEMNRMLNDTLRYLSLIIPFSVLLIILRKEVVLILFQRGRFDAAATALTAEVLVYLLIGAAAFAFQTIVVRGYYASQDTVFPTLLGTIAVVLSLPLYFYAMQFMGAAGVALAISLSAICQVMMLYMLWNRRTQNHESRGVYLILEKVTLISLIIGIILESFKKNYLLHIDSSVFSGSLAICLIIGAVFIPLFLAFGYIFRIEEMRIFLTKIIRRIR
ncbi:MAG TPA: murein biosynthesis integral membrane protein MurJ [Desulfobacteraceae bacterium]|nr:murein biosynthesis integral membrane protein MurJ [Desulfobacteraceae bacterium]